MQKTLGKALVDQFLALDGPLNAAATLAESIEDEGERKAMKNAIAEIGMTIYTDLIRPVTRVYPDLEPQE
jgi:hypothetical protein